MKRVIKFLCFVSLCAVLSCNSHVLDRQDYVRYLQEEENGSIHKVTLGELTYTFQFRPYDLIALQENKNLDKTKQAERTKELEGTLNFVLKIKTNKSDLPPLKYNISSIAEYNARLSYFSTAAQKDFSIKYGDQVLIPTAYAFETNYGLTPEDAIVLQFTLPNHEMQLRYDIQLCYTDRVFQNGIIKTKFLSKHLNNIPKLNV